MRTVAGPWWLLLAMIAATMALSAGATSVGIGGGLTGVLLGQALVAVLAVLVISGEYSSGMIRTTLTAIPHRATAFAAKAITLTGVVAAAATAAVSGSLLAGRLLRHGHPGPSLAAGPTLRAAAGSILYLTLIALLSLGIATIVRDAATSIGVIFGLLYLLPLVAQVIGDPYWQRLLQRVAPTSAGPGVTAGWAAVALGAGYLLLRRRDA